MHVSFMMRLQVAEPSASAGMFLICHLIGLLDSSHLCKVRHGCSAAAGLLLRGYQIRQLAPQGLRAELGKRVRQLAPRLEHDAGGVLIT